MQLDTYKAIDKLVYIHTTQHRRASINRLIASLQPKLLCTIVNENKLNQLIDELNQKIENCSIKKSNNWFENSNAVLNFFTKELNRPAEEIMTLPWQVYLKLTSKKQNLSNPNFMDDEDINQEKLVNMEKELNQIFFGPPGTGKTYHTINEAIKIIDYDFYQENKSHRNLMMDKFKSLIYDQNTNSNGQIIFTTFHQSMSYEDFIEGIKPKIDNSEDDDNENSDEKSTSEIEYVIQDGIFKEISLIAKKQTRSTQNFNQLWDGYISNLNTLTQEKIFRSITSELKYEKDISSSTSIRVRFKNSWDPNQPEGTRSFIVSKNMIERLFDAKLNGSEENKIGRTEASKFVGKGRATHIYAVYKDFYQFAQNNHAFENSENLNYVLIIDEINRGNVSQIFGELITLIEEDKRIGKENELSVTLPYSKESFSVPSNLYIIGTMNTADRSVEALDTALRRRFAFTEMLPQPELLSPSAMLTRLMWKYEDVDWKDNKYLEKENSLRSFFGQIDEDEWKSRIKIWDTQMKGKDSSVLSYFEHFHFHGYDLQELLETINKRIEVLVDRDHTIGHAYLMDVDSEATLKFAFKNKIIPLLQEYFYGNYEKMEMVIGSAFFEDLTTDQISFARGNYEFNEPTKRYKLKPIDVKFDIKNAIDLLLNKKKSVDN